MGVDTSIMYHQAGPDVEPTRQKKKRSFKEHVEMGSPDRHKYGRIHLEAD